MKDEFLFSHDIGGGAAHFSISKEAPGSPVRAEGDIVVPVAFHVISAGSQGAEINIQIGIAPEVSRLVGRCLDWLPDCCC